MLGGGVCTFVDGRARKLRLIVPLDLGVCGSKQGIDVPLIEHLDAASHQIDVLLRHRWQYRPQLPSMQSGGITAASITIPFAWRRSRSDPTEGGRWRLLSGEGSTAADARPGFLRDQILVRLRVPFGVPICTKLSTTQSTSNRMRMRKPV
jgi:hypothetical protein